jgi:hypothetical protein
MAQVKGVHCYEERMLCLLMLLQLPRTRVVFLSSRPVDPAILDYHLSLVTGVPARHARARLRMVACAPGPPELDALPLSQRALQCRDTMGRLAEALGDTRAAHMVCFTVTEHERGLALALDVPINGCDPDLAPLADKSGGRRLFREAGLPVADGQEDLRDADDIAAALAALKTRHPGLRRAMVKLNEGFSGDGNAVFRFDGAPEGEAALRRWARANLPEMAFEGPSMDWPQFETKFRAMGGVAEAFVEGADKRSPSLQCRIDPGGRLAPVSTHDQVLGGPNGGVFQGCVFPADPAYRMAIQSAGLRVGELLRDAGALGRFSVDFLSTPDPGAAGGWAHVAVEINLRKGGTTHPFLTLQMLTGGAYDADGGCFRTPDGRERCYYATDNLESPGWRGVEPETLIDRALCAGLLYDPATAGGASFHLLGALKEHGKMGAVCVAPTAAEAEALFDRVARVLDASDTGASGGSAVS